MRHYTINSPQVISEDVSGETVIINLETGTYFNLNEEAAKLWAPLSTSTDLDALKKSVQPEPACEQPEAESLIEAFFEKLISQGLIKKADAGSAVSGPISADVKNLVLDVYTDMQDLLGLDPIHEVETEAGWPVQKN